MVSVITLFFLLLILFFSVFIVLNRDLFSPTVMICISFIIGALVLSMNVNYWNVDLNTSTIMYIVMAIGVSFVTELSIKSLVVNKRYSSLKKSIISQPVDINIRYLKISNLIIVLFIAFSLVEFIAFFKEINRIAILAESYGYHGTMMNNYRLFTAHSTELSNEDMMNTWVMQGFKVVSMFGYISAYTAMNNLILCNEKVYLNLKYFISIVIYMIMSFFNASRSAFISFSIFLLFISYVMLNEKKNWKVNFSNKFIRIGIMSLIGVLFVFIALGEIVGRTTNNTAFQSISVYIGAPIYLFNLYLQNPPAANSLFGQETLNGIYKSLYKLHIIDFYPSFQVEFRYANCDNLGNVYTFLRRPLHDYGILGLFIIVAVMVAIYSYVYYKKVKKRNAKKLWVFLYGYFFNPIPMAAIDFIVYSFLTLGTITTILFLVLGFKYLIKYDDGKVIKRRKK